jgi:hypothetical protein
MKTAEEKTFSPTIQRNAVEPFFKKGNESFFDSEVLKEQIPFFTASGSQVSSVKNQSIQTKPASKQLAAAVTPMIQTKCPGCEKEDKMVQRQEEPDTTVTKTDTSDPNVPATTPKRGFSRAGKCNTSPEFPNFGCFTTALKLDIDENLWNNAHQFYRVATLFPDDKELMWNTFLRYGLGANLLQTSFGFLGANKTLGTALSYGTGIGLKSYGLFKNGKLELDIPIPLGKDLNLDLKLDLNTDPNNLTNIKGVNTGIGIRGHF